MITTTDSSNHTSTYSYDGDGHRVKRNISGTETWQIYGLAGELIAEYAQNGSASGPQKEYGYRNGQLLVTVTGSGTPPTFTDNPLTAGASVVKAVHLTELRDAINQARTRAGLAAATWTDASLSGVYIKAVHITELRTRLDEARAALGLSAATYTDASLSGVAVKAIHITELRARVAETVSSTDIRWMVSDQLGTPRMIFDQSGSLASVSRHDYLPFGEELFAGASGRTAAQGYNASDGVRQHFSQKERDNETGLDYFGARYYSSAQGRFTSVDPSRKSVEPTDPQSWDRYSYTLGNPLKYIDPNGKWSTEIHNRIIDKAFPGLTNSQREILKRASRQRDSLAMQTAQYAFVHAMSSPGQSPEEAKKAINKEIQDNERAAQQFQSAFQKTGQPGLSATAILEFGNALHTVTDRTSPTHTDANGNPMVWPGIPIPGTSTFKQDLDYAEKHAEGEKNISDEQMNNAVTAAREEFRRTFGEDAYKLVIDASKQGALEPPNTKKPDPRDNEPESTNPKL